MKQSLAKLTLISTLMLAANSAVALPNDNNDKDEEIQIAEEMLIQAIDPETGLVIYIFCPTLPDCDDDYQSMAELDQDEQ